MKTIKKIIVILLTLFISTMPTLAQEIHEAAKEGYLEKVKMLLEKDPQLINTKDETGRTPLHWACRGVHIKIVEYLIENGADVNARDINNVTPLHSLSYRGQTDCIELLIKNGADIETKDASGLNALFYAAYGGHKGAMEALLKNGVTINTRNKNGLTPADIAKDGGHAELAQFLISQGGKLTPVKNPEVFNLTNNIYKITFCYNQCTNIIVFAGSDSVLVIDTGYPRTTEKLKSTIEKIAEGKKIYIINTHLHIDHIGGNNIADDEDKIINFENLDQKVSTGNLKKGKVPLRGKSGKIFETYYVMNFNDKEIRLIPSPGAHTDADLIIHIVDSGIVHMGDLLISQSFPSVSSNIVKYLDILEKAIDIFPEYTKFIAGHGHDLTMRGVKDYQKMLINTIEIVKKGIRAGKSVEDMQKEKFLKDYESYNTFIPELSTDFWIGVVYRSYENDNLELKDKNYENK